MAIYELGLRGTITTAGSCAWEARAVGVRVRVRELGLSMAAATASTFSVVRNYSGPGAVLTTAFLPADDQDPPSTAVYGTTTFAASPRGFPLDTNTQGTIRRFGAGAAIGTGFIWTWSPGRELIIPPAVSLGIFNEGTNGVIDAYASVDV